MKEKKTEKIQAFVTKRQKEKVARWAQLLGDGGESTAIRWMIDQAPDPRPEQLICTEYEVETQSS